MYRLIEVNMSIRILSVLLIAFVIQGCVATQSFPTIARAGDTITISVGSPDDMTTANTTVSFTSDVDASVTAVPIRNIMRLYPDPTSEVAIFNISSSALEAQANHEQWLTVMVLDLPPGLTTGTGYLTVTTAATYGPNDFLLSPTGKQIGLEIIDNGQPGSPTDFSYFIGGTPTTGTLLELEPLPQAIFRSPISVSQEGMTQIAAAEIVVNVPMQETGTANPVSDTDMRVIVGSPLSNIETTGITNFQSSWSRTGDDIKVNIISPGRDIGVWALRFSVVTRRSNEFHVPPTITSVTLYDNQGNVIAPGGAVPDASDFTINTEYN